MKRFLCLLSLGFIMTGCATPIPPETIKNLYEVEASARKMEPQNDVALLYVLEPQSTRSGLEAKLMINNEPVMEGELYQKFYVFCLPPDTYNLTFVGDLIVPNKSEFIKVEAGNIYIRSFKQMIGSILLYIPLVASNLSEVELKEAKEKIEILRIGEDEIYQKSRFRCRKING